MNIEDKKAVPPKRTALNFARMACSLGSQGARQFGKRRSKLGEFDPFYRSLVFLHVRDAT